VTFQYQQRLLPMSLCCLHDSASLTPLRGILDGNLMPQSIDTTSPAPEICFNCIAHTPP
jgi:hypothetical protein